jgi:hypothetical protein
MGITTLPRIPRNVPPMRKAGVAGKSPLARAVSGLKPWRSGHRVTSAAEILGIPRARFIQNACPDSDERERLCQGKKESSFSEEKKAKRLYFFALIQNGPAGGLKHWVLGNFLPAYVRRGCFHMRKSGSRPSQ